ncbi:6977_t:CDS:2 [Ambispora leptoticha]|uniref:Dihydrolipoamide acetyltransferase component of pyruvate dehydrogenase complex n=1 Tax=Ambispora leptoticha TaxID=144679 RepID=A0A9N8Z175_9GLOM|nr:6977_t:CDS:2 [Ambispora leptoticha]
MPCREGNLKRSYCTHLQRKFSGYYDSSPKSTTSIGTSFPRFNISQDNKILFSRYHSRYFHATNFNNAIIPFVLADVGEGITECEITQWYVKPGDQINEFDKLCEVQSDKASVEITSRYTGTIVKIHYNIGEMARVGMPIVDIEAPDEVIESFAPATKTVEEKPSPLSSESQNSFKGSIEPQSPNLAKITLATPAVRRLAREFAIDISKIQGTGKAGRVSKDDVLNYVAKGNRNIKATPLLTSVPTTTAATVSKDEIVKLSSLQKSMFKTMTRSLQIPHFGYSDEYCMDKIIEFKNIINENFFKNNRDELPIKKVSFMPFFIKTFSTALLDFPVLNATIIDAEDVNTAKLHYRSQHNIGIAMDTPGGLIVPNIKNVQEKSIFEIAQELHRLQEAGKQNAIPPADLKDGTITLSNIGIIGGEFLNPVVVSSELCLAAIGKINRLPRFEMVNDEKSGRLREKVVAKSLVKISFCADHRVIDGATVARFSETWKNLIENPVLLSFKLK